MKNKKSILTVTYPVHSYLINDRGNLSVISLFNMFLDAAGQHAHELGLAVDDMMSRNYTWVLSRLKVRMDSWPAWRNEVTVQTWPSGVERLFAYREFRLTGINGGNLGSGVSAWIVIDTETRRPVRPGPILTELHRIIPDSHKIEMLGKLPGFDKYDIRKNFRVLHRDIDMNNHVTSVSYIEWMLESVPDEIYSTAAPMEIEINYLAETWYGDCVISQCNLLNDDHTVFHHSIIRASDHQELSRARTIWKPLNT